MTLNNIPGQTRLSWRGKYLDVDILYSKAGTAQQILINSEHGSILVDAGDGVLRDLLAHAFSWDRLKGIVFTHGHFDHIGGLYSLLGYMRMIGRNADLKIIAPKNCDEVSGLIDCFLNKYAGTNPYKITAEYLTPGQTVNIAALVIRSFKAVHYGSIKNAGITAPLPALSYRISAGEEVIALSGDTGTKAPLDELVKGVDLAILEATYENSSTMEPVYLEKVHLSEDIAHNIGRLAKDYILIHKGKRRVKADE
jgi:ribonuclease BN (tRNA processing enzyme)